MLVYVPAVVLWDVWIVKVACAEPLLGTDTEDEGDHEPKTPGIWGDQFNANNCTVPANPPILLTVTVYTAELPLVIASVGGLTEMLKSPLPV